MKTLVLNTKNKLQTVSIIFAMMLFWSGTIAAQNAESAAKPFYHLVDSVGISGNRGLKLAVTSPAGDSTTIRRVVGVLVDPKR